MKIKCPVNPLHDRFMATAHVTEDWILDKDGHFVEVDKSYTSITTHYPTKKDVIICKICGSIAKAV